MARTCKNCGASIEDELLFCPECGNYVSREEPKRSYSNLRLIAIAVVIMLLITALGLFLQNDPSKIDTSLTMISDSNLDSHNTYSVQLIDANNNSLADQYLTVQVNNTNYTLKTDSNGIATMNLTVPDGPNEINTFYKGNDEYWESHTSDIVVK